MAKQMKLIPLDEFEKLKSSKDVPKNIDKNIFLTSEDKATSVLEESSIPNDIKLSLYSSL